MKRLVLAIIPALICGVMFISCNSKSEFENDEVITLSNERTLHLEKLQWLKDLIDLSKTDKTGHYLGCIWLENYKGQDIFVTNMMLGSGGVMYWYFDSSGNHFISREWGYESCPACNFAGNHHVFSEDIFEDLEKEPFNMKLDVLVYSSLPVPCK